MNSTTSSIRVSGKAGAYILAKIKEIFGRNFSKWLELEGKRQDWVARQLKVPDSTVTRWKTGANIPRPEKMESLAVLMGIPIPLLFVEDGVADPKGAWEKVMNDINI